MNCLWQTARIEASCHAARKAGRALNNAMVMRCPKKTSYNFRIKFHPLRGLQFLASLVFFLFLLYPLRGLWLNALEYDLLMVCDDTNHGKN